MYNVENINKGETWKVQENYTHQFLFGVKDDGIGIPQNKMIELFEPFTQL